MRRTINAGGLNADEVLAQELKVAFGPPSSGGTVISPESQESRISERTGQVHVALFVCLLALLGPLIGGANTRANDSQGFAAGHGLLAANDRFAIDDFDGDLAPDIAIVQPVSSNSSGTNYIVQLQFGSGQRRSICLAAHWRDVRIVARDVNGDRIPNLILSSAWSEEPYAVLTNEGNSAFHRLIHLQLKHSLGNLSRVSIGPDHGPSETAATSPSYGERDCAKTKCIGDTCSTKRFVYRPNSILVRCPLLVSLPGRAPPRPALVRGSSASHKTGRCQLHSA